MRRRAAAGALALLAALTAGGLFSSTGHGGPAAPAIPVGGLTALPPPQSPGPNLVDNAGFERAGADGMLPGWGLRLDGEPWSAAPEARTGALALRLAGAERGRRVASAEQVVTLQPGLYTIEGWVKTQDVGGRDARSGVRLCLDGRPRLTWWQCTPVARGTADWTLLRRPSIAVREPGAYRVWLGAYGAAGGTAWFDDVSLTEMRRPPLDVFLLYPNFRGMLFDDRAQAVRVAVGATEGERVRLSLLEEGGERLVARQEVAAARRATVELDAAAAPPGAYRLRAELLDAAGASVYRHPDYRIVKVPGRVRRGMTAWYDEHNVTYLGGKPAFVLGLYNTHGYSTSRSTYANGLDGWGNDRISQAPVNMLINYHLGQAPLDALRVYMDDLYGRGIHYLQTVNFYHEAHPQYPTIAYPAARNGEDALNAWVARALGAHPGLAGFYTADERPAEMVPTVFRQHRQLSAAAPGSLAYAVLGDGWEHQAPLWRDALDVMGLDPYPITRPAGQNHLAMVGEWTRLGQEAVKGSRPLWMVIQYFPLTAAGGWPSEQDLRAMSWMAIVDGARGLFYWSFGAKGLAWIKDAGQRERKWAELVRVTREIKALEPVLLAPDAALLARESSGGVVRTLGKQMPDGARYLFAYNTAGAPATVTWTLAAPAAGTLDLASGQPGPAVEQATLTVDFAPYEVKRYRIR